MTSKDRLFNINNRFNLFVSGRGQVSNHLSADARPEGHGREQRHLDQKTSSSQRHVSKMKWILLMTVLFDFFGILLVKLRVLISIWLETTAKLKVKMLNHFKLKNRFVQKNIFIISSVSNIF